MRNPSETDSIKSQIPSKTSSGKKDSTKDAIKDTTSDSQVNSCFPYRWPPASLTLNIYFHLFLYWYTTSITINNGTPHLKPPKNQNGRVHFYEGDVWQVIRDATLSSPLAVWLLGGHDRQLSVDQFVLQDGRTYRNQEAHERLQAICARLGNHELAERAFGESHAASIMTKKRTPGSQPKPASSKTLRWLVWSTDTAGCGTRWITIRGTSSALIWRPAIRHLFRVWVKRNPILSGSGILPTIWPS